MGNELESRVAVAAARLTRTLGRTAKPVCIPPKEAPCVASTPSVSVSDLLNCAALLLVLAAGLFLLALAGAAFLRPALARRFLSAFASSPGKHYFELAVRLAAGSAFVVAAPRMPVPLPFQVFGWALVLSTLVMACLPWRWHQRFAQRSVPRALQYLPAIGACSLAAGAAVLLSVAASAA